MQNDLVWNDLVNKYSLSKTLRFELRPVDKDRNLLSPNESNRVFADIIEKDKKIKQAYIILKPILDKIHEQVINKSLSSKEAKEINFSDYYDIYKKKGKLKTIEKDLREEIVNTFKIGVNLIKENSVKDTKGKSIFKDKAKTKDKIGIHCLTESGMLEYIKKNIFNFTTDKLTAEKLKEQLDLFNKFWGYFEGYNLNRLNYYDSKEKSTAIATRIVHKNLPKFCDNCIQFSKQSKQYLDIYKYLNENGKNIQIKDASSNKFVKAIPINEDLFYISNFSNYLSQSGIDEYNRIIGNYNLLINLYNQQTKSVNAHKLDPFKTLYKQIGCGKKEALFDSLKYDTLEDQIDANEESDKIINLQDLLDKIIVAENKYLLNEEGSVKKFVDLLKNTKNWAGIYWSNSAVEKIFNQYLINFQTIENRLLEGLTGKNKQLKEKYQIIATFKKNREEKLKFNDTVELSVLFEILDTDYILDSVNAIFKESVLERINKDLLPSQNLISLICEDINNTLLINSKKEYNVLKIKQNYKKGDYKKEENILIIKEWLDTLKQLIWHIKYFEVKENKIKSNPINPEISNLIAIILYSEDVDWFNWYDVVRNYLCKKPQDDAKKNKLKLNFDNAHLLGGLSDGEEQNKGAVILKHENKYYLGVLVKRSIFSTAKKNNPMYNTQTKDFGRMILKNLGFKTLAGKGFKGVYGESYGDMGKRDPQKSIKALQEYIKNHRNYLSDYPLLKTIVETNFTEKKEFDKKIKDILLDSYQCYFKPINWDVVSQNVSKKNMYLFEIYNKDFSQLKGIKSKNSIVNLHTLYWNAVFQENSNIQLCGGGKIFFRKNAIKDDELIIHSANLPIKRRSDGKDESLFSHQIIKDKRFTMDKYFLHIPIVLNYKTGVSSFINGKLNGKLYSNINSTINNNYVEQDKIQIMGIDRGENHLIYYYIIDNNGNYIDQGNFDIINNKNYLEEINKRIKERNEKQGNWQQKGEIKNIKEGYMSLVVHEIIQKMKDKNTGEFIPTFIVLEYLNKGFKRSRQKFEQQVYQNFELALAKKLNYLVDKTTPFGKIGHVSSALQLTPPVANYQDIEKKKQFGIMFYVRAQYTSITDPVTGWRKTIYIRGNETEIKNKILDIFTEIRRTDNEDYFLEYVDMGSRKKWRLWSGKDGQGLERYLIRFGKAKHEKYIERYDPKKLLDELFKNFDKKRSLKEQLYEGTELGKLYNKQPWESLLFVINLIQQIRNNGDPQKNQAENFLLSPVRDELGLHFDSRNATVSQPKNADANGAYNIARKGLITYEHIKYWYNKGCDSQNTNFYLNLFISDEEWDLWLSDRDAWKKKLPEFVCYTKKDAASE